MGYQDKYLVVGIGDGEAAAIWGRSQKAVPQWLTNLQAKLKVERPSMVQYVNLQVVEGMAQMALTVVQGPEASKDTLDTLGLTNAKYFASVSGLEKDDFANRMLIATDGPPMGLLALLTVSHWIPNHQRHSSRCHIRRGSPGRSGEGRGRATGYLVVIAPENNWLDRNLTN